MTYSLDAWDPKLEAESGMISDLDPPYSPFSFRDLARPGERSRKMIRLFLR